VAALLADGVVTLRRGGRIGAASFQGHGGPVGVFLPKALRIIPRIASAIMTMSDLVLLCDSKRLGFGCGRR
jgi:hypothetical protein